MEKQLVSGKIGAIGSYEVAVKAEGGKLKVVTETALEAGMMVDLVINAAKEAIPGHYEDAIFDGIAAAAKKTLEA